MSKDTGNWRLDTHWNRIVSDVRLRDQTPEMTAHLNGYLVCDTIADTKIARRIVASVRACKDLILEDLEQQDSGYWVRTAKTAQAEIKDLQEENAELLESLRILLKRVDKGSYPSQEEAQERQQARAAIARATGADTAQDVDLQTEQTEPDYDNLARDYIDAEMDANQPTPYDP